MVLQHFGGLSVGFRGAVYEHPENANAQPCHVDGGKSITMNIVRQQKCDHLLEWRRYNGAVPNHLRLATQSYEVKLNLKYHLSARLIKRGTC